MKAPGAAKRLKICRPTAWLCTWQCARLCIRVCTRLCPITIAAHRELLPPGAGGIDLRVGGQRRRPREHQHRADVLHPGALPARHRVIRATITGGQSIFAAWTARSSHVPAPAPPARAPSRAAPSLDRAKQPDGAEPRELAGRETESSERTPRSPRPRRAQTRTRSHTHTLTRTRSHSHTHTLTHAHDAHRHAHDPRTPRVHCECHAHRAHARRHADTVGPGCCRPSWRRWSRRRPGSVRPPGMPARSRHQRDDATAV